MGMVKAATHRIRFRIFNLTGFVGGLPQFPVNCWRATFIVNGTGPGETILDGVDLGTVLDPVGSGLGNPVVFVVGGVFMPDGSPAIIDQRLLLQVTTARFVAVVCEYLEPL